MAAFTEKAIVESFIKLLNDKPLDKIKIKDIIDDCGVNRSTFYYYFEDIYDLLSHVLEIETNRLAEPHTYDNGTWAEGIIGAMSFAIENKKAIYHIYKSVNREQLERYLTDVVDSVIIKTVKTQAEGIDATDDDIRLVADIYEYTMTGLIFKWLEDGMTKEPMDQINKLGFMMEGKMRELLLRAHEYDNNK